MIYDIGGTWGNFGVFILIYTELHHNILHMKNKSKFPMHTKKNVVELNWIVIYFVIVIDLLQSILKLNKTQPEVYL